MLSLVRTLVPLAALLLLATRLPSALGWSVATYATADCTGPTTSYKSGLALDECVPTSGGIYASSKIYCTPAKDQKITEMYTDAKCRERTSPPTMFPQVAGRCAQEGGSSTSYFIDCSSAAANIASVAMLAILALFALAVQHTL